MRNASSTARSGGRSPDRQWYAVEQQGLHWCVTPALGSPAQSWIKLEIVEDSGRRMTFVLRRRELIRQTSRQSSPSLTDRTGPGSSLRLLARTLFSRNATCLQAIEPLFNHRRKTCKRELQVKNTHLNMAGYLHYGQLAHHCFRCSNSTASWNYQFFPNYWREVS
jgi:hypothetical protein